MYQTALSSDLLLSNVDASVSKSAMNIAFEYAKLCEDEEVRLLPTTLFLVNGS